MKKLFSIGLAVYWATCLFPPVANGADMSSPNYNLEKQDIEIGPPKNPSPTPTKEPEKPYASGKNYTITTNNPSAFTFSVSHAELDFGKLTATNPVIRLLYLTTTSSSPYWILSAQNHQLTYGDKTIPDSTCDNGSCTEETDSNWVSALTYGFGYQTQNMPEDNYRQFSDLSRNESLENIVFHSNGSNLQDKVIYKINISTTHQPGAYNNIVTYLAIPNY